MIKQGEAYKQERGFSRNWWLIWPAWYVLGIALGMVLSLMLYEAFAVPHTITLMAEQETALLAATEQANERQGCTMASCGEKVAADGTPLVPLTVEAVVAQILSVDLANLKLLDAATLTKVLGTVASQDTKDRLQKRLQPWHSPPNR